MKVLVLSDIHGNLDAWEAVLSDSENLGWKELWFLGDLAGYGPEPDKCFRLLKSFNIVFIPGNHDLYFAGKLSSSFFSREAIQALLLTGSAIKRDFTNILKDLPVKQIRKGVTLVHGSPENPPTDYILTEDDAGRNFKSFKGRCCLFGHTHRQECFVYIDKEIISIKPEDRQIVSYKGKRILINPGSVGQPRDNDPRAAWAILDTGRKEVQFYRTAYNIQRVQEKMKQIGSSKFLIERLEKGM